MPVQPNQDEDHPREDPLSDVESEPSGPSLEIPDASSFDWDSWSGHIDDIPEPVREWSVRARDWAERRTASVLKDKEAELEERLEIYQQLISGVQDPRVDQLSSDVEEYRSRASELEEQYKQAQQLLESERQAAEAFRRDVARMSRERFEAENPWIFDNGPVEKAAVELLQEGWEIRHLPKVLKLTRAQQEKARKAFAKNPAASEEILLWVEASQPKPTSTSRELVGGASSPAVVAPTAVKPEPPPKGGRALIEHIVQKNMRRRA